MYNTRKYRKKYFLLAVPFISIHIQKGIFHMTRRFSAAFLFIVALCSVSYSAQNLEPILKAWSRETHSATRGGDEEITIKATYYSAEYIEALVQSEAERNMWTADESENYKYSLLKNVNLSEAIPIHIEIAVRGAPVYLQPFDKHIQLMVNGKKYAPTDYDKRFNFKLIGARDGMVYFPRYDEKTGKDILSGAKELRVIFDGSVSHALMGQGSVVWIWDLTKDRGKVAGGRAADRLEADRLIKRSQKIDDERAELRKKLDELNAEYKEVNERIDELQSE